MTTLTKAQLTQLRDQARESFGCDGDLEVDSDATVVEQSDGVYRVDVWVWVPESNLTVAPGEILPEADLEARYIAAAEHPVADFDGTAIASLGDDPGAYVRGFVVFGADVAQVAE